MDTSLYAALGLGFVLGIRHAIDADHLAAVSTLVSQHRSLTRTCLLGTFWGLGHTVALLAAGVATIALRVNIPAGLERSLEQVVGCMLILLGAHVLVKLLAEWGLHTHGVANEERSHRHADARSEDAPRHAHAHLLRVGRRPFIVGVVHGMAGSAALMLLVAAALPSPLGAFLYILVFGIGSTLGMLLLSGLIGLPFALAAEWSSRGLALIQAIAGVISGGLGLTLLWSLS